MVNTLGVVMVEIKEMNQGNERWSQPSKDLENNSSSCGQTFSLPDVQLRQHSLEQPPSDFQAHPQQRLVPEVQTHLTCTRTKGWVNVSFDTFASI